MPDSPKVIHLRGNLTVDRATALKDEMAKSAVRGGDLTLDFSQAATIDLSFVQLIYATSRKVHAAGGKLRFAGDLSAEIGQTLAVGGLSDRS
jgi:anti-anti-sigma regulatory factor